MATGKNWQYLTINPNKSLFMGVLDKIKIILTRDSWHCIDINTINDKPKMLDRLERIETINLINL